MQIEKLYFTLPEILKRWSISEDDLIYLAENDKIRLSVRVYGVPLEFGDFEETPDGQCCRIPGELTSYGGLLDLHAQDVFQLFRYGEIRVRTFRTTRADYAVLQDGAEPILVLIGDLLMRRDERDRFEKLKGFSERSGIGDSGDFWASDDYREVRCNGHHFKLGPIQAEVVRALHEALEAGQPWQNGKVILTQAGSKSLRMADVFKSKKSWRQLIRSDRKGGYRLNTK